MKYLAAVSSLRGTQEQKNAALLVGTKINQASPPLEAFGNAKTVRNDNSSRFGKFMKVQFDQGGYLIGAHITKYLLEKSRIICCSLNERVYHAFYLVLRGRDRESYGLTADDNKYRLIVSQGGAITANKEFDTAKEYDEVISGMQQVGIKQESITSLWAVVAGILNFENVDFEADGEGSTIHPSSLVWLDNVTRLWGVDRDTLLEELVRTKLKVGTNEVTKLLNTTAALDGRSALSKTLYDSSFSWLVEQCNATLSREECTSWIGLLDIFGFEDFERNSFEQVCINLANETLQGHYNTYIFQRDMDECRAEGVDVADVPFPDNTPCLQLLMAKGGVISLLDEECQLGKGTDLAFLDKICEKFASHKFFVKNRLAATSFIVKHYAGDVSYEVEGFREKNMDTLKDAWKNLLRSSTNAFCRELLPAPLENSGPKVSVGAFFKNQLFELMGLINSTNPHWIRCVKPHPAKKPLMFDGASTMNQLSSSGVLGTVKIRKAGYPVRINFADFCASYKIIAVASGGFDGTVKSIIAACGYNKSEAQVGRARVFMRSHIYMDLETKKKAALATSAKVVHTFAKVFIDISFVRKSVMESNKGFIEGLRPCVREIIQGDYSGRASIVAEEDAAWLELSTYVAERIAKLDEEIAAERERRRQAIMEELRQKHTYEREGLGEEENYSREAVAADWKEEWLLLWEIFEFDKQRVVDREHSRVQREAIEAQKKINSKLRKQREEKRERLLDTMTRRSHEFAIKHAVKAGPSEAWLEKQRQVELDKQEALLSKCKKVAQTEKTLAEATCKKADSIKSGANVLRTRHMETQGRIKHRQLLEQRYVVEKSQDFEIEKVELEMLRRTEMKLNQERLREQRAKAEEEKKRRQAAKELEERTQWLAQRNLEIAQDERQKIRTQMQTQREKQDRDLFLKAQRIRTRLLEKEQEEKKLQSRFYNDTLAEKVSIERPELHLQGQDYFDIPLRKRVAHADPFIMSGGRLALSPK
jgi:myosin heavy subunit